MDDTGGRVGLEGVQEQGADAAGFEGAGRLEVLELEEDAAGGAAVSWGILRGKGGRGLTSLRLWRGRTIR